MDNLRHESNFRIHKSAGRHELLSCKQKISRELESLINGPVKLTPQNGHIVIGGECIPWKMAGKTSFRSLLRLLRKCSGGQVHQRDTL